MAKLNWLEGTYTGRLGASVGSKWKSLNTVRTYTKGAKSNTEGQRAVRDLTGFLAPFLANFAQAIKPYTAYELSKMSYPNHVMRESKALYADETLDPVADCVYSKGSLLRPKFTIDSTSTPGQAIYNFSQLPVSHESDDSGVFIWLYDATTTSFACTVVTYAELPPSLPQTLTDASIVYYGAFAFDRRGRRRINSYTTIIQNEILINPPMTSDNTPAPYVASASSRYGNPTDDRYRPFTIFDQMEAASSDALKYWCSATTDAAPWVQIDLGAPYPIATIVYRYLTYSLARAWSGGTAQIMGSNDGNTWSPLTSVITMAGNEPPMSTVTWASQSTTPYRYIRCNRTRLEGQTYATIGQIWLYRPANYQTIIESSEFTIPDVWSDEQVESQQGDSEAGIETAPAPEGRKRRTRKDKKDSAGINALFGGLKKEDE